MRHRPVLVAGWILPLLLLLPATAAAQRFGLWAGEGESLRLARYDIHLEVDHPVARTTIIQEFDNPHPFNLEATFVYPVPAGATVTGLALWVKGERREARLLERGRATEIYQSIVQQKRDPALLERVDGNTFRIRVFPVLARSRARIELSFVQPVESLAESGYRLTLRRPPSTPIQVLRLSVRLRAGFPVEAARLEGLQAPEAFAPADGSTPVTPLRADGDDWSLPASAATRSFRQDITLRYRASLGHRGPVVVTGQVQEERLFVAELPWEPAAQQRQKLALLLDTSRSMEPQLPLLRELGRALLQRLSADDAVALVPFALLPRGPVELQALDAERRQRLRGELNQLRADRGGCFLPAVRAARAAGARHLVLVSDGGSPYHAEELEQLLRELTDRPGPQISTIVVPGARNEELLRAVAQQTGGLHARLGGDGRSLEAIAAQLLTLRGRPGLELDGGGRVLLWAQARGGLVVAGRLPAASQHAAAHLRVHNGETIRLPLQEARPASNAAIAALYGNAAIESQMKKIRLFGESPELRQSVVDLSLRYRVVSEYTALLATETDADYQRPTSGEPWQRKLPRAADDLPPTGFQSTPEPHQIALLAAALLLLAAWRRWRWRTPQTGR